MRFLRKIGIPAIGFAPMNFTEPRLHRHNEYLNSNIFLKGIAVYCSLIQTVANLSIQMLALF